MKVQFKTILATAALISLGLGLQACDGGDISGGGGIIIGGIHDYPGWDHDHGGGFHPGPGPGDHGHGPGPGDHGGGGHFGGGPGDHGGDHGGGHSPGGDGGHFGGGGGHVPSPGGHGGGGVHARAIMDVDASSDTDMHVAEFSAHYDIPTAAASALYSGIYKVSQKDMSGLTDLGLTQDDVTAIANNQNPSADALINLSNNLGLDLGATNDLIQDMKQDFVDLKNN